MVNDEFYLSLAINEAWKYQVLTYPNPSVGCTVIDNNGALLSIAAHKKAGDAHAELEAAKKALKKLNSSFVFPEEPNTLHAYITKNHQNLLKNSTFYVTLEPCSHQGKTPSCAKLLCSLGVKKVVIGTRENNKEAANGANILQNHGIKITCGILEKECEELIEPFKLWQKRQFSFFKIAMRLDGTYDSGIVTSEISRKYVHDLRNVCDLIAVGGETVRKDRPILDARMVNGCAPDVLIFTRGEISRGTPLFDVKNRKVLVQNSLDFPLTYKNIMVEGGSNLLNAMQDRIDWFLIFKSSSFDLKGKATIKTNLNLKPLFNSFIGKDSYCWYKKI